MYTARNQFVIDAVRHSDQAILDVGCGTGQNAKEIKNKFSAARVVGLNFSAPELEIAREYLDFAIKQDLNQVSVIDVDETFDLITCSHVMEHLVDPKTVLQYLTDCLNDQGRILVVVPNFAIWSARLRVLFGGFRYEESGLYDRTHLRFFTYLTLENELVPTNLRVVKRLQSGHFPLPLVRNFSPKVITEKLDRLALKYWPNLFSNELALILEKA